MVDHDINRSKEHDSGSNLSNAQQKGVATFYKSISAVLASPVGKFVLGSLGYLGFLVMAFWAGTFSVFVETSLKPAKERISEYERRAEASARSNSASLAEVQAAATHIKGVSLVSSKQLASNLVESLTSMMELSPNRVSPQVLGDHLKRCEDYVDWLKSLEEDPVYPYFDEIRDVFKARQLYSNALAIGEELPPQDRIDKIVDAIRFSKESLEDCKLIPEDLGRELVAMHSFMCGSLWMNRFKYEYSPAGGFFPVEYLEGEPSDPVSGGGAIPLLRMSYQNNPRLYRACINLSACYHHLYRACSERNVARDPLLIQRERDYIDSGMKWASEAKGGALSSEQMVDAVNNLADLQILDAALLDDPVRSLQRLNNAIAEVDRVVPYSTSGTAIVTAAEARCAIALRKSRADDGFDSSEERKKMSKEVYCLLKSASATPFNFSCSSVDKLLEKYPDFRGSSVLFGDSGSDEWMSEDPSWIAMGWKERLHQLTRPLGVGDSSDR
jgi:hypothetical protein